LALGVLFLDACPFFHLEFRSTGPPLIFLMKCNILRWKKVHMQQQVARIVKTKPNPTAAIVALRTVFIFFFLFSLVKKRIGNVFT
jgi:hypothetical protein